MYYQWLIPEIWYINISNYCTGRNLHFYFNMFFVKNCKKCVLSQFSVNKLLWNQLILAVASRSGMGRSICRDWFSLLISILTVQVKLNSQSPVYQVWYVEWVTVTMGQRWSYTIPWTYNPWLRLSIQVGEVDVIVKFLNGSEGQTTDHLWSMNQRYHLRKKKHTVGFGLKGLGNSYGLLE